MREVCSLQPYVQCFTWSGVRRATYGGTRAKAPRRGEKARANETLPGIQADSLGGGGLLRNEQPDPPPVFKREHQTVVKKGNPLGSKA